MALPLTAPSISSFSVALPDEHATQRLAIDIANSLQPGDLVTLSGDLGAGKTTFARALIRYLAGDPTVEVPSPTFTLMQIYDLPQFPVVHADLYRLSRIGRARRTRLRRSAGRRGGADRMAGPRRRLPAARPARRRVHAGAASSSSNSATPRVTGYGAFGPRVDRMARGRANSSPRAAMAKRSARACRATPRRAPTSGSRSATST